MAYVLKLEGVYASYPLDYFREKLGSEEEAGKEVNKRNEWYGVVDGEHRASALQRLICKDPEKWADLHGQFMFSIQQLRLPHFELSQELVTRRMLKIS